MSGPRGGDVAQRRHPRAGTGSGSYYGNYWHGGGHKGGYYKPYYGHGYWPYYGSYYRPYFYGSIYWGWPYYSWPYYSTWPYYTNWPYHTTGSYYSASPSDSGEYYAEGYRDGANASSREAYPSSDYADDTARSPYADDDRPREPAPAPSGRAPSIVLLGESGQLRLEVRPDDASVYVDDEFRGTATDARQLTLAPGRHTIELVRPGFGIERREVEIVKGERTDLLVELRRP